MKDNILNFFLQKKNLVLVPLLLLTHNCGHKTALKSLTEVKQTQSDNKQDIKQEKKKRKNYENK